MRSLSGAMDVPASVLRLRPRAGFACRSASTIAAFNPPRGWAQIAAQMVSGLTRAEGVIGLHKPQSLHDLPARPAPMNEMAVLKTGRLRCPRPACGSGGSASGARHARAAPPQRSKSHRPAARVPTPGKSCRRDGQEARR
jgi:hypothetical protein